MSYKKKKERHEGIVGAMITLGIGDTRELAKKLDIHYLTFLNMYYCRSVSIQTIIKVRKGLAVLLEEHQRG